MLSPPEGGPEFTGPSADCTGENLRRVNGVRVHEHAGGSLLHEAQGLVVSTRDPEAVPVEGHLGADVEGPLRDDISCGVSHLPVFVCVYVTIR